MMDPIPLNKHMSQSTNSLTPGCTTFTATSRPCSVPRCTCATHPEPRIGPIVKSWSPNALLTESAFVHTCGSTRSCNRANLRVAWTGNKSSRDAAHWHSLIKVGPARSTSRRHQDHHKSSTLRMPIIDAASAVSRPTINGVALRERFMALLSKRHRDGVRRSWAAFSAASASRCARIRAASMAASWFASALA